MREQFKALASPARIEILNLLSRSQNSSIKDDLSEGKEISVHTIVESMPLSPSTISHHLNILKKAGIVNSRKDKQWIYYSINRESLENMREFLSRF